MPKESVTLIGLNDRSAWEAATLDALPGQTWGHAAGLAEDGLVPQLAVVQAGASRMILPFHQRVFGGHVDIATLPGLSGALLQPDDAAPLAVWAAYAARQGWVAGYLQLSALNGALQIGPPDRIWSHNSLFVFDLDDWDISASVGYKMRRNLKAGDRMGAALVTDLPRLAGAFYPLHAGILARWGDVPDFSERAVARWFAEPGIIAFGAEMGGEIVNIQIGRRCGNWADLHLAGATEAGRSLQAWVIWQAAETLRREGVGYFNIGGYGEAGDGLHRMKARYGAAEHPLRAVLQIYDPPRFARLCQEADADPLAAYFPPYRARALPRAAPPATVG